MIISSIKDLEREIRIESLNEIQINENKSIKYTANRFHQRPVLNGMPEDRNLRS